MLANLLHIPHAFVRPILEYATEVWDPHHKFLVHKIEMVKRRAARWVQSDYRFQSSVTAMIDELGWVTLKQQCKKTATHQELSYQQYIYHMPPFFTLYLTCCQYYVLVTKLAFFTVLLKTGTTCH